MGLEAIVTDGGFISDGVRDMCDVLNIDLVTTAIRGKEQTEDVLTSVDFPVNETGLISSCPADITPVKRSMEKLKPKYLTGRVLFRGLVRVRIRMIVMAMGVNFRRSYHFMLLFIQFLLYGNTGSVNLRLIKAN